MSDQTVPLAEAKKNARKNAVKGTSSPEASPCPVKALGHRGGVY